MAGPDDSANNLKHRWCLLAGFLQPRRVQKLDELAVSWQPTRTDADVLWDARLTQLLSFRREHGHVQVSLRFSSLAVAKCYDRHSAQ